MTHQVTQRLADRATFPRRYAAGACVVVAAGLCAGLARAQLPPRPTRDIVGDDGPALFVSERFIELGTIIEGETPTLAWTLENQGRGFLQITKTRTSCGCTVVSLTAAEKRIAPGGSFELTATFDSQGRRGEATKNITVYSNDPTEPELKLEFHVKVEPLYNITPPGIINLRMVRRGDVVKKKVELVPAEGRSQIEIVEVVAGEGVPLTFRFEPFATDHGTGQRIYLTIAQDVPLGPLRGEATVRFTVDGIPREHNVVMRGQVVGDITWRPSVLDMTRRPVTAGRSLSSVVLESTSTAPFEVVEVSAGPLFDVKVDRKRRTSRSIELVLRGDAPPGPFATSLVIRTDSLDQPLVSIPVFGIVAPAFFVDPPLILLRADGTKIGVHRHVKIRAAKISTLLRPTIITCDDPAVTAVLDEAETSGHRHMFFLDVTLVDTARPGRRETMITIETGTDGVGTIRIPVVVDGPQ